MIEHYGRGYVYSIQYHLVWCTKYRKKVIFGAIEESLKTILRDVALEHKIEIVTMEANEDHIHLLIDVTPQHYIPDIIKVFKGVSARRMFILHLGLKEKLWGGALWNPSYYVGTVSDTTQEQIMRYIETQKKEDS